jgi:hypothetical protein
MARSLVDAAVWMATDRGAQAVLAAGVQQRLVRIADLSATMARNQRLPRRGMITDTLEDIAGGAHALSEPPPDRQASRTDSAGRRRWLDAVWKAARLVVEVDGRHHMDAAQYWADMDRDNDLTVDGYRVLRFPRVPREVPPRLRSAKDPCRAAAGRGDADPGLIRTG